MTPPHLSSCGISVFVTDEFVLQLKTHPISWLGPELTIRAMRGAPCILDHRDIRVANSNVGLNLIVWTGIASPAKPEDFPDLAMEVMRAFWENHAGYRLNEIIAQPNGIEPIRFTLNSGMMAWDPSLGRYVDGRSLLGRDFFQSAFLLGTTRETALGQIGNRTSMLFVHNRPRIFFRPTEQRLLLASLRGLTDEDLADELAISLSAVKKTWRSIYDRASLALPHLNRSEERDDGTDLRRGKEKKQRLLSYLRDHRHELRPILPPKVTRVNGTQDLQGRKG